MNKITRKRYSGYYLPPKLIQINIKSNFSLGTLKRKNKRFFRRIKKVYGIERFRQTSEYFLYGVIK